MKTEVGQLLQQRKVQRGEDIYIAISTHKIETQSTDFASE